MAALAIAAVCALAAVRPWGEAPSPVVATAQDAAPAAVAPAALALPDQPRVLIFGDSWTYGSAAALPTLGYAYVLGERLGWETIVDGVRGSGYLKPGLDGGAYGERIAALDPALDPDLVIIEGSINDRRLPATGYQEAVTAAWDALAALYPSGDHRRPRPGSAGAAGRRDHRADRRRPVEPRRRTGLVVRLPDHRTSGSPRRTTLDVIDTAIGRYHPSTGGHAYLATRLAESLAAISGATDVVADAPHDAEPTGP